MKPTLCALSIVIMTKSYGVLNNIKSRIHKSVPQDFGAAFRHFGSLGIEVTGLVDGRIKPGVGKQLMRCAKPMNVANLTKNYGAVDRTNAWNGHNDGIKPLHDLCDGIVELSNLSIVMFDGGDALRNRNAQCLTGRTNRTGG